MLDIRIRQFLFPDTERFTEGLKTDIEEGSMGDIPIDPDTDALVVEDILGRVYGILIKREGLVIVHVDEEHPILIEALINEHLGRIVGQNGKEDI